MCRKAIELATGFRASSILIEDKASGQQLIQELRADKSLRLPLPIARMPEQDKFSRLQGVSAMIEGGHVLIPIEAPWLAEFKSEILAFPNGRFDDQVDALSQLLSWVRSRWAAPEMDIAGPVLVDLRFPISHRKISRDEYIDAWGA